MPLIIVDVAAPPGAEPISRYLRPDLTTGLIASYTQGSIVGEIATEATSWPSALPGGLPLAAASGTQQPTVGMDGFAQKQLQFAGTDRMSVSGLTLPEAFTVAVKADFGVGGTDGWPISLESATKRIAIFDAANTLSGYAHVSGGTSSASSTLSSADPAGLIWLVVRGTWGGALQVWRGAGTAYTGGTVATAPAFGTAEAFTMHVGARATNASPKAAAYQQVRVFNRALEDPDLFALIAS